MLFEHEYQAQNNEVSSPSEHNSEHDLPAQNLDGSGDAISCRNGQSVTKHTIILYYYSIFYVWGVCLHFETDLLSPGAGHLFHSHIDLILAKSVRCYVR